MPNRDSTISLREITRETLRDVLRLKVAPEQEKFVATNAVSIAQAHFYPETAWFRAIYADDTPVGFVMIEERNPVNKIEPDFKLAISTRHANSLGTGTKRTRVAAAEHTSTKFYTLRCASVSQQTEYEETEAANN